MTASPSPPLAAATRRILAGAAAATVLVGGFLLRPATPVTTSAIEERPAPILEQVVTRRDALTLVTRLQQIAGANLRFSARLLAPSVPRQRWSDSENQVPAPRFAAVVAPTRLIGQAGDLAVGTAVDILLGAGRRVAGRVGERIGDSGLAFVDAVSTEPLAVPSRAADVRPGEAAVGTGPGEDGALVVPLFVAGRERGVIRVTAPLSDFEGMPVFDDEGALLGIVAATASGTHVLPDTLLRTVQATTAPRPRLGLTMVHRATAPGAAADVVVLEVVPAAMAALAGLRAGDVLISLDGEPPASLENAGSRLSAASAETPVRVVVRRGRRTLRLQVPDGRLGSRR